MNIQVPSGITLKREVHTTLTMNLPMHAVVTPAPGVTLDGNTLELVAYPGWRFADNGDGTLRHERIPPWIERWRAFLWRTA